MQSLKILGTLLIMHKKTSTNLHPHKMLSYVFVLSIKTFKCSIFPYYNDKTLCEAETFTFHKKKIKKTKNPTYRTI